MNRTLPRKLFFAPSFNLSPHHAGFFTLPRSHTTLPRSLILCIASTIRRLYGCSTWTPRDAALQTEERDMRLYSTGEVAKRLGITRDALFAALKAGAPDAKLRIGNRRVFTETEVKRLAEWFERRRKIRDGLLRP